MKQLAELRAENARRMEANKARVLELMANGVAAARPLQRGAKLKKSSFDKTMQRLRQEGLIITAGAAAERRYYRVRPSEARPLKPFVPPVVHRPDVYDCGVLFAVVWPVSHEATA